MGIRMNPDAHCTCEQPSFKRGIPVNTVGCILERVLYSERPPIPTQLDCSDHQCAECKWYIGSNEECEHCDKCYKTFCRWCAHQKEDVLHEIDRGWIYEKICDKCAIRCPCGEINTTGGEYCGWCT